jgi:hypothetical protein
MTTSADVVIHLDLNKTILAVDEVKDYGANEVVYLEQWKKDPDFLSWAHATHGGEAEKEAWIADLKVSKNEPQLIGYAHEYCDLDEGRKAMMTATLGKIDGDNCVHSFWRLLEWIGAGDKRVLVCFRTFGSDMPSMFDRCIDHGYEGAIERDADGKPKIWTMLHHVASHDAAAPGMAEGFGALGELDVVDGMLQPGNPVPGPKEKGTDAFAARTVPLEKAASAQFAAGGALRPALYTAPPPVVSGRLLPIEAVDAAQLHDVSALNAKLAEVTFEEGVTLKIMGVQDNYKPWSRKNYRNGKVVVLAPESSVRQVCFDDYSFTKADEAMGTYIYSIYGADGKAVEGTKSELQAQFSAEPEFRGKDGNVPSIFTALLNKKGETDTAVENKEYFVERLSAALGL